MMLLVSGKKGTRTQPAWSVIIVSSEKTTRIFCLTRALLVAKDRDSDYLKEKKIMSVLSLVLREVRTHRI